MDSPRAPVTADAAPRPRRRFGFWKVALVLLGAVVVVVAIAPMLLSLGFVHTKIEESAQSALGVPVKLRSYGIGWLSGLHVEGLTIDNPPGFPPDKKLLKLESMTGDVSLTGLLRGKVALSGKIAGLDVRVHQKADGTLNVVELGKSGKTSPESKPEPSGGGKGGGSEGVDLSDVKLDLQLVDALVEIESEQTGVLESIQKINASIQKPYGTSDVKLQVDAELHGPKDSGPPGKVALHVDADANLQRPVVAKFETTGLDFARYRPLLAAFVPADQITAFEGKLGGAIDANVDVKQKDLALGGKMELDKPHFAGPMLQGMDLQADKWVIEPVMKVLFHGGSGVPDVDTGGLHVDLGFVKLDGMPAADARKLTGDKPAVGAKLMVDIAKLAEAGGPLLEAIKGSKGSVQGQAAFVTVPEAFDPEHLKQHFADYVNANADVSVDRVVVQSNELQNLTAKMSVQNGAVHLDGQAQLNGGTAQIVADTDLHDMQRLPGKLKMSVKDAKLGDTAVGLIRYAVPVFAGLDVAKNLDFSSKLNTEVEFNGPLMKGQGESVLQWLNGWSGAGNVALKDGQFKPAAQLAGLLQLTGQNDKISFDDLSTSFKMAMGAVETSLVKLSSKAQTIGLSGRTTLTGDIDYAIDLTDVIKKQKYGEEILKALGGKAPAAKLTGTLDAPKLELPDLGALAQQAAGGAVQKAAEDALQKNVEKGLEGLDKLLKKKQ